MAHRQLPFLPLLIALTVAGGAADSAVGQVPGGQYVVTSFTYQGSTGGVFLAHPRNPGPPTRITGLPAAVNNYANSVALLDDGRTVVVGTVGWSSGQAVELHWFDLVGSTAVNHKRLLLGTTGASGLAQVAQIESMGVSRVLVFVGDLVAPGPLAGELIGEVDLATGTVFPWRVRPLPAGQLNAGARGPLSPTLFGVHIAMVDAASLTTQLYNVPWWGGSARSLGPTLPISVSQMSIVPHQGAIGALIASGGGLTSGSGQTHVLDLITGAALTPPLPFAGNGVAVERVTGGYAAVEGWCPTCVPYGRLYWVDSTGTKTLLTSGPAGGWGIPTGLALLPNPRAYGDTNSWSFPYRWQLAPNPGGLPLVGNSQFSLQIDQIRGGVRAPGYWFVGTAQGGGIPGLLLGGTILLGGPVPVSTGSIQLPIPNVSALRGATLHLQTVHPYPSALVFSEGLRLTVL